jgi:hypothetical protein
MSQCDTGSHAPLSHRCFGRMPIDLRRLFPPLVFIGNRFANISAQNVRAVRPARTGFLSSAAPFVRAITGPIRGATCNFADHARPTGRPKLSILRTGDQGVSVRGCTATRQKQIIGLLGSQLRSEIRHPR